MVNDNDVSFFKYSTAKVITLKGTMPWALLYYFLVFAWAVYLVGWSLIGKKHYLYRTYEKGTVETRITGYAIGTSEDGSTQQYFDVGDLVYPNSADSTAMFIAASITSVERQTQMFWNIREWTTNEDCEYDVHMNDSGVTGAPIRSDECNIPTGFWRDLAWCPTIQQNNRTYLINDFSNMYLNMIPHAEIYVRKGDDYRATGSPQRISIQRLIHRYIGNVTHVQQYGSRIQVYYKWQCKETKADDGDWDPEIEITNEALVDSLIPNASNQTTRQTSTRNYELNGVDMRDQSRSTGLYISFISTFRIREIDIAACINYAIFIIAVSAILHTAFEGLISNNPFHSAEDRAYYQSNKYSNQVQLPRQSLDNNNLEESEYDNDADEYDDDDDEDY